MNSQIFRDHPLRHRLSGEVHTRPFMHLESSERASHLAMFSGVSAQDQERAHVADLCQRFGAPPPDQGSAFHYADLGNFRLRWERHTEFSTYTFFAREPAPTMEDGRVGRFEHPVIQRVPEDWLASLPGDLLAGVHLELEGQDRPALEKGEVSRLMGANNFAGATMAGGAARGFINFAINDDGFGRIFIQDIKLGARQAGRLVQRLFEIETYRLMASLAFPQAKTHMLELAGSGERLTAIMQQLAHSQELMDEQRLLDDLTGLSAEIERIGAETSFRFAASRAYYTLVERRIEELREERLDGHQTLTEFIDRRLTPAMRTCEAVTDRLDTLSKRVARAGQLLRTRVDLKLEQQNRDLLASMDRRARLQVLLQETVEGLSVAAITYYGVGLVVYGAKALKSANLLPLSIELVGGLAIPIIATSVWVGVRRVRRMISKQMEQEIE
ncbi:DUF3422 family protein [Rhodovibrionaceae bacterium A322]